MVVLEAFGLAAAELFNYNREIFKFDQEQRLEKDLVRVEMQIKRFNLFREDIEDLVKLTVSKMDMYHMVGALLLAFTCTLYTEGLFWGLEPPWYTGVYYMSVCGGFVYLLLAVWLSMHASIQAQSYGVRLRTRFVRLPIPSLSVITDLTSRFADFERQGVANLLRLPFSGMSQAWKRREQLETSAQEQPRRPAEWRDKAQVGTQSEDLIGRGEAGFGREDILATAATAPGRHVQLFRRLQAKWQCYDAYARVSMSLGVNQIIQAVNYFVIGATLVERNNPATAIASTIILQAVALGITQLDIADKPISKCLPLSRGAQVVMIQCVCSAPAALVVLMLTLASTERGSEGELEPLANSFFAAPAVFFLEAVWFQLALIAAWPSADEATLPRKFLAVLFLDVFGDDAYDPTEGEQGSVTTFDAPGAREKARQETLIAAAESVLEGAQVALRRWEAIPHELLTASQAGQLDQLRQDYMSWRRRLQGHIVQRKMARGVGYDPARRDEQELRPWAELSALEKHEDGFAGCLIGPLQKRRSLRKATFYYDLDLEQHVLDSTPQRAILTLQELSDHVGRVKMQVREVLASEAEKEHTAGESGDDSSDDTDAGSGRYRPFPTGGARRNASRKKVRLPWKMLRRLTQVLQLGWIFLGIQLSLQNSEVWGIGWMYGGGTVKRRLQASAGGVGAGAHALWLGLARLAVAWPHGGFFRPAALSCLPSASGAAGLLVSSPYAQYQVATVEGTPAQPLPMMALPREAFPPSAVAVCGAGGPRSAASRAPPECWLAAASRRGVALWRWGESRSGAVDLPLEGRPWRLVAGAVLPCSALAPREAHRGASAGLRCLVLAGWDGVRLPVAVVPLPRGGAGAGGPLRRLGNATIRPRFDAPLQEGAAPRGLESSATVAALHLEPGSGRLWALVRSGLAAHGAELRAWALADELRSLGSWPLRAFVGGPFAASALCEDGAGNLIVAGLAGGEDSPQLLRVPMLPLEVAAVAAPPQGREVRPLPLPSMLPAPRA